MSATLYAVTLNEIPFTLWYFVLLGLPALLATISIAAISVKRLHDLNRSGWWIVVWYFAMYLAVAEALDRGADTESPIFNAVLLAPLVALGLFPGTPGANRFGPEPTTLRAN